jgi:diguanylate cyclase (GGDEF)-like protein
LAGTVLIVDDSATIRAAISAAVLSMGMEPLPAESGERALELFHGATPSLVLLDVTLPGIDGYETARRMRAANRDAWVPIIFLSSSEYAKDLERAIEAGGDDYLTKPVSPVVLSAKIRALQRLESMRQKTLELSSALVATNQRLEALTRQDPLTGVANRRGFDERIATLFALARRGHQGLSLAICDVDYFKAYNDRYGHPAGDSCLRRIAAALMHACQRETDFAARYGGEEFALLLPGTPADGAARVVEVARQELASPEAVLVHEASPAGVVSFSAGVAVYAESDVDFHALVARADEALYRAKQEGRNRTVVR